MKHSVYQNVQDNSISSDVIMSILINITLICCIFPLLLLVPTITATIGVVSTTTTAPAAVATTVTITSINSIPI